MNVADVCQICFESFNENDNEDLRCDDKVVLPCHETHVFGRKCIAQWFDRSKKCPICRSEVPSFILESMPLTRSLRERVIRKVSQIATDVFICAASSAITSAIFIGASGIIDLETGDVESALAAGVSTAIATGSVFGAANSLADLKLFAFTGAVIGVAGCPIAFAIYGYLSASHFAGFATGAYVCGVWSSISSHLDP
ncbi:RING finger domain-containing protein [Endozoicomonas sp. ALD040]|uniref:RING finger domain-containing protein n=1 Tax=unclassified Endozoicomonas TaxID=2644528 RepID=UPI003BB1ABBE